MKKYNISDFGAYPSDLLMTAQIQAAIDACAVDGGGEVIIPEGTFRTGSLVLKSGVWLHLLSGAELEGSRNPDDYFSQGRRWHNSLIEAYNQENIGIIGDKYSRLNGMNCYDPDGEEKYRGPHGILMDHCRAITLSGYQIRDAGNWGHILLYCDDLSIVNVGVYGGHDGIDIHCCTNTSIENCEIHTGDDAIAGFGNEDCVVRDCVLDSSCNIVRFGGVNCTFERCTSPYPSTYGHRYGMSDYAKQHSMNDGSQTRHGTGTTFQYYCDKRWVLTKDAENIVFKDCVFDHPGTPFAMAFNGRNQWCCYKPLLSLKYENCTLLNINRIIDAIADQEHPISIEMKNCLITADPSIRDKPFASICNCKELLLENVTLEGFDDPRIIMRSKGNVTVKGGTEVKIEYVSDPKDTILTLEEIREKIEKLPSDEAEWKQATDAIASPDESRWDSNYSMYRPLDNPLGHDCWTSVMAVFRNETSHAKAIGRSCVSHYGYFVRQADGNGSLVVKDFQIPESPDAKPSGLFSGPFAYALFLDTPITARAFLTDYVNSKSFTSADVAGVKLALAKMI